MIRCPLEDLVWRGEKARSRPRGSGLGSGYEESWNYVYHFIVYNYSVKCEIEAINTIAEFVSRMLQISRAVTGRLKSISDLPYIIY